VRFAQQAGMGEGVVQAIALHAHPERSESHRTEVAMVALANDLAKAYGVGFSGSRLTERDGEFADHAAWSMLEQEMGRRPDVTGIAEEMKVFVKRPRSQLAALRSGRSLASPTVKNRNYVC
jgi:hypothetical protein